MENENKKTKKKSRLPLLMILLAVLLCAEACVLFAIKKGKMKMPEAVTPEPAAQQEEQEHHEEPETVSNTLTATVRAKESRIVLGTLRRGDEVELISACPEDSNYFIVSTALGCGMVERRFLATESYRVWTGYSFAGTRVYSDADMTEYICSLEENTSVEVTDDFGSSYLIKTDDICGFTDKTCISGTLIDYAARRAAAANSTNRTSGGSTGSGEVIIGGGGGTGGGSTGGGTAGGGTTGGTTGGSQDGGDITLSFSPRPQLVKLSFSAPQNGESMGTAKIRADGTELILAVLFRGDTVAVLGTENGVCTILIGGMEAYMDEELLSFEGDREYARWKGYSRDRSFYRDLELRRRADFYLEPNSELTVLEEFENCLLVSIGGELFYTEKDNVSASPALSEAAEENTGTGGGNAGGGNGGSGTGGGEVIIGGGGGGDNSGGGGSTGGGESTPDWSEPVL